MKTTNRRALGTSATFVLLLLLGGRATPEALASPTGGIVLHGSATITPAGNVLTINQLTSRAIINWSSFNIAQGETTLFQFNGPAGAHSAVLNRVDIGNPSVIAGMLQSRVGQNGPVGGTVLIMNPSGMVFTPTSQINVGNLIATTLSLSDDNAFMNNQTLRFEGSSTAGIRNQGTVNALGDVFLIAHTVQNAGTINSGGHVGLAAGTTVTLTQEGSERLTVEAGTGVGTAIGVENTMAGQINAVSAELKAAGGNIYALAINNGGAIRANSVSRQGGRIVLRSDGGTVVNQGLIEARGTGMTARGGEVQITGGTVHLTSGSTVDVSGDGGGGTALIGGDYQGRNPLVPNSRQTIVDDGAVVRADAISGGNGGRVIIWSDGATDFRGSISVRGGFWGGDGGFVEVSGHDLLTFAGQVNASARAGWLGRLLIDPAGDTVVATSDPGDGSSFIDVTSINNLLATTTFMANQNFFFNAPVNMVNNGVGLIAQAGNNVVVNSSITTRGGPLTLSANDNFAGTASGAGSVQIASGASIITSGGGQPGGQLDLVVNGGSGLIQLGADLTTGAGAIIFNGPVVQSTSIHVSSSALGLGPSWDAGNNDLRLTIGGPVTVPSIFANVRNFTSDGAGGTVIAGDFATSGSQTYANAVSQTASARLVATALTVGPSWNAANNDLQLSIAGPVTVPSVFANVANFTSDGAGGTIIAGNFTTAGSQTYANAVSQTANARLTATALALGPSWNAANNDLRLTISEQVTVPSIFANVRNFTSDGGGGTIIAGNFITSGSQTYLNAVSQTASAHLTATALTLGPSWNAANNDLQLTIAGPVTVSPILANIRNFTSDGAGGTIIAGDFSTFGDQTYANAVSQTADAHLTASALTLGPAWNAANHDLRLTIAGAVTVPSVFANVANFTSDGLGGTIVAGNFTTSGGQTYLNAVSQTANAHLTATALTLGPSWNAANNDLQLTIAGPVTVSAALANVRNFTSDGAGGTVIAGDFATSGSQSYLNAVSQTANAHLTATALTLGPSWNAANNDLQLTITGPVTVPSVFANVRNFTSDGAGGTVISGDFATSGSQSYLNAVSQTANARLTATALTLGPSWNAANHDLRLTIAGAVTVPSVFANVANFTSDGAGGTVIAGDFATSGSQSYLNAVSQIANAHLTATALTLGPGWNAANNDLHLTIAGPVTVSPVFANVRNFTSDGAGGTTIAGDFATSGSQSYLNAVSQTANARLTATALTLGPSWNAANHDLRLTIAGAVTVPSVFANVANFTSDGLGGTIVAGNFTTSGSQSYLNAVSQTANARLTATALTLGPSWNAANNDLHLTIAGPVTVSAVFANVRNFTSDGAGGTTIAGDFATSGSQSYLNAVSQTANAHLTATALTFGPAWDAANHDLRLTIAGPIAVSSAIFANVQNFTSDGAGGTTLAGNFITSGSQTYANVVSLAQTLTLAGSGVFLNGGILGAGHDLTINANTALGGVSSGLGTLTVNGATALNGSVVSASGSQNYNGAVTLGANNTLNASSVNFNTDLVGGGHDLTVNGATTIGTTTANSASGLGALTVNGATTINAGAASAASATFNGATTLNGGSITTAGAQNYNGVVTLGADYTLQGSTIGLNQALVGGTHSLTANGNTTLGGNVSGLSSLTVNGTTRLAGGSVTTSGAQIYNGDATLGVNSTLNGLVVDFRHGLDGSGRSLLVNGNTTIGSAAADTIKGLSALEVNGNTILNGTFREAGSPAGGTTTRFNITGDLIVHSKVVNYNQANVLANVAQNSVNGDWVSGTQFIAAETAGGDALLWLSPLGITNPGEDTFRRMLAAALPQVRKAPPQEIKASEGTRPPIDFAGWNKGSSDVFQSASATAND